MAVFDITHHDIQGVRDPFAAHVEFRFEVQFAFADGGIVPTVNRLRDFLCGGFEFVGGDALNLIERQLAGQVPDDDGDRFGRDARHFAYQAAFFDPDLLSHLQRGIAEGFHALAFGFFCPQDFLLAFIGPLRPALCPPGLALFQLAQFLFYIIVVRLLILFLLALQDAQERL